jgi:hypothetical protein
MGVRPSNPVDQLERLPYSSEQMNRSDLIQLLADRFSQLTHKDAEAAVSTILDTMNNAVLHGTGLRSGVSVVSPSFTMHRG